MKSVILIHPKIDFKDNYPCCWIPFSILSIGSSIKNENLNVHLYDENCITKENILNDFSDKDVLLVGISIMTGGGQINNGLEFAKRIRKEHPEAKIVFGGPHANVLPEQTLANQHIDYVVCGMGQNTFAELAELLNDGITYKDIPGLYYKRGEEIICPTIRKASIPHLVPYNFSLIDLEPYIKYDATISNRTLNYVASQGCPYGCSFCYECNYGRKYYNMSPNFVCNDIALYAKKYHVDGIKFYDADFFINKNIYRAIIAKLKEYGLRWAASIHPNDILRNQRDATNSLLKQVSESQCTRLLMGMESGSNRILREVIHKNTKAEDYITIAKVIADYGILGSYTFMVGFPGETKAEYNETFELVHKLWNLNIPLETKIHIYLPYPGTPLYSEALSHGYIPPSALEGWSDYNYYKSMTPWTDDSLEKELQEFTRMIDKNIRRD